jgi:hypothetical protein
LNGKISLPQEITSTRLKTKSLFEQPAHHPFKVWVYLEYIGEFGSRNRQELGSQNRDLAGNNAKGALSASEARRPFRLGKGYD